MKRLDLPPSWRGRAVIITDVDDPESWFTAAELSTVRAFAREKRRREWMLSRIAESVLREQGAAGANVSFSHSGRYGAAAVGVAPVGIDVEVVRPISERAAHLFLTDEEIAVMERCTIEHRMLHFWGAKEALWKQRGGAVATLKKIPLTLDEELRNALRFRGVETYAAPDVITALTTED